MTGRHITIMISSGAIILMTIILAIAITEHGPGDEERYYKECLSVGGEFDYNGYNDWECTLPEEDG